MAFAAGGSSAPTISAYEGGERVGGKLLNRSHRRNRATPYDRPPAARGSSWISKVVVDPAKKLIAASARTFFSSVFSKRLPPPPPTPLLPAPEAIAELSNGLQDPVRQNGVLQSASADSHHITTEDSSVPTELLQLLKQHTFTRPEADHLIKLLDSKAPDLSVIDDVRRVESSLSKPVLEFRRQEQYSKDSSMENWRERDPFHAVLEEDITFPTELAKEYMGSRWISKGSPSLLSYRDQGINEDGDLSNGVPSAPSSRATSLVTKSSRYGDDRESSLTTPRFRARSAIHKMASSRIHTPPFHRGSGSSGKSSASPTLLKQDGELGWKEPSRKRSSALLDDFGSGGTVRRIRRKYGLVSHKVDLPFGENYNFCSGQPFSLTHKHSFMDDWRLKGSKPAEGVENTNNSSTRFSHLHSEPSQHADARVSQNLEKMAPKVKLAEAKLIAYRQKTPFKLTKDMLSGKALKSLESLDSLKLLQGTRYGENLEESSRDLASTSKTQNEAKENGPDTSHPQLEFTSQTQNGAQENGPKNSNLQLDFTSHKQNEEENGPEKPLFQLDLTSQKHNGTEENGPEKCDLQFDTTLYMDRDHIFGSPTPSASRTISVAQKKHAFMMSVPEDFLDMDEDTYGNGPAAESLLKEREENKSILAEGNPCPPGKLFLDEPPALPETRKAPLEHVSVSDNSCVSVDGDGTAVSPSSPLQLGPRPALSSSLEKSKDVESLSASISEVTHPKFSPSMQPEPLRPIRLGDAADVSLQVPESGKLEVNILPEGVNANEKPETKSSVVFSSSMPATSSSSILPGSSNIQNGPMHLNPSTISSTPTSFGNQASVDAPNVSSSAVSIPVATTQTSATSSSSLILPVSQPSMPVVSAFTFDASHKKSTGSVPVVFGSSDKASTASAPSVPAFTFGASDKTSTAASVPASFAEASVAKNDADKEVNQISDLGSHIHSSTDKSQPQDAGIESTMITGQSEVGSGAATVSPSIPFQFASSPSTAFSIGTSGITPFVANTASSSSSSRATNLFSSVPSFGLSSSTSSLSEIKSVTTAGSGSSSSTFTFGATVSSGPNAVGNAPSVFNIGAGSSGTTGSSVTPGMFIFGATSSSNVSNPAVFGSTSSSNVSNPTAFGSTLQTPNPAPFSATFNQTPSGVFAFGASSPNIPTMAFGASSTPTPTPTLSSFTNHDQMNGEDNSMAEDPVQSSPIAGFSHQQQQQQQPPPSAAGGFLFGSTAPPPVAASAFPFGGGQQTQVGFPNNSFQGSGSLEFNTGGSFSLGSNGGGDKSNRKYVKPNRNRNRSKK